MLATAEKHSVHTAPVAGVEEHAARAALYGVLSHLLFSAPSPDFLQQIAASRDAIGDDASPLALAWRELCDAAGRADATAVRGEFDTVFVSPGKPPVSLYASSYMAGRLRGQLLAELRDELARMGYARAEESTEYEDHLSALCDVMRGLIVDENADENADEQDPAAAFAAQQVFFRDYLAPWFNKVCAAINNSGQTAFYRPVAAFAHAFFINESEYFELA
jgi:TorA maturation chaperone TorD